MVSAEKEELPIDQTGKTENPIQEFEKRELQFLDQVAEIIVEIILKENEKPKQKCDRLS